MEITKFSASAMETAEQCLARWDANNKAGRRGQENTRAAMIGTACHGAMEGYVRRAIMTSEMPRDIKTLEALYAVSYMDAFENSNLNSAEYKEGWELLKRWFARTIFDDSFKVLMVEEKLNFQVPTGRILADGTAEMIPFNYIFDRFDQLSETEFRVMDYKTLSRPLSPLELKEKIQPRVYGLAAQIMYPQATKVWVGFDMLRWEGGIETVFTRQDNIDTWIDIKAAVKRIVDTDPEALDFRGEPQGVPESLNENCGWCVMKTTCKANQSNVDAGGVWALDLQGQIDARALFKLHEKAAKAAVEELDKVILAAMQNQDVTQLTTDLTTVKAVTRGTRSVHPDRVRAIVGDAMFEKYGNTNIKISDFDALLKDPELDPDLRPQLENLITRDYGAPYVDTKGKKKK